jgi:anti-anti-sigma factor
MPRRALRETAYPPGAVTDLDFEHVQAEDPDVAIVELRGEIDLTNASDLSELVDGLDSKSLVILDLNQVSFVDSAALHALFRTARKRGRDRFAIVADSASPVSTTFEIVQLGRAAPIVPAVADALARARDAAR